MNSAFPPLSSPLPPVGLSPEALMLYNFMADQNVRLSTHIGIDEERYRQILQHQQETTDAIKETNASVGSIKGTLWGAVIAGMLGSLSIAAGLCVFIWNITVMKNYPPNKNETAAIYRNVEVAP